MDLLQLRAMGLVNPNPLLKRTIKIKYFKLTPEDTWANPTVPEREEEESEGELDFWIRKFTAADSMALAAAKKFDDQAYEAIFRSVFTEEGEQVFPDINVAREVNLKMFNPLLEAIFDLNGVTAKKSPPKTNSGASSASSSENRASRRSKRKSRPRTSEPSSSTDTSSAP